MICNKRKIPQNLFEVRLDFEGKRSHFQLKHLIFSKYPGQVYNLALRFKAGFPECATGITEGKECYNLKKQNSCENMNYSEVHSISK